MALAVQSKRAVRQEVMKSKTPVFNAEQFCDAAQLASEVNVILIHDQEILDINKDLHLKEVFETAPDVNGISKIHAMEYSRETGLKTYFFTKDMPNKRYAK